jgi:hypothetical protein
MITDVGDDVKALQQTINRVRSADYNEDYSFGAVSESGAFDQATTDAVYILQGYFKLPETGIADLKFQSSLYQLVINNDCHIAKASCRK